MNPEPHPVALSVEDDYVRNRLTVFFRLLLGIPHYIWFTLWSLLVVLAAIVNWFATLITGRPPRGLHNFLCAYVRYSVHLSAYLYLVGNPYPGFVGEEGEYPVDVTLPADPQPQSRWKTLLRLLLAIPAFLIGGALGGGISSGSFAFLFTGSSRRSSSFNSIGGPGGGLLLAICAFLGWFASLVTGRMPSGLRDAGAYGIGYAAQVRAYSLLLTDRYPNSDPTALLESVPRPPRHPVHLVGEAHDLRRSRLTVFFRLPLTIPHFIWLYLWGIAALFAVIAQWFVTLFSGTPARSLHRFLGAYVRQQFHVLAYVSLAANPFPGFLGEAGSYPLDLALPDEDRQNRWKTFFRIILVLPAVAVVYGLEIALYIASFCTWFAALVRGSAPWGLRNLMAYALRYLGQVNAYLYLLTDAYPHASPLEGEDEPRAQEPELSAV